MEPANELTRVLIADDHPVMLDGLRAMVDQEPDMEVIAAATNGVEAIELARNHAPDVILMDLQMPRMDGLEAIATLRSEQMGAAIVVLTTYPGDARVSRAIAAGAMSYLLKSATSTEIVGVIRSAANGHQVLAAEVATEIEAYAGGESLTEREISVLELVSQGNQNSLIGTLLNVSEHAIKNRLKNILSKLQARDRTHAVTIARTRGFLDM